MNVKFRKVEIDAKTADALEAQAAARGMTISELVAQFVTTEEVPPDFEAMRATGRGPWAPEVLAEDARRFAAFERTGEGVPWEDVKAWMKSWGSPKELPSPKPRKL